MKGGRSSHVRDVWPRGAPNCPCTQPCTPLLLTFPCLNRLHLFSAGGKLWCEACRKSRNYAIMQQAHDANLFTNTHPPLWLDAVA